jgi:hypothetical protein
MHIPPFNYLEFYKNYQVDYWNYKIGILKNSLDNFDEVKETFYKNLQDTIDKDCILMIKTDLHFIYFQIIEALFELIFALEKMDERNLWYYLSFPEINHYDRIKKIAEGDVSFLSKPIKFTNTQTNKPISIPFLDYVFYHLRLVKLTEKEREQNFKVVEEFLKIFAKDFSDRCEYNAYKHALRFFYSKPGIRIESHDKKLSAELKSKDGFTYLEKKKDEEKKNELIISKTVKAFDSDRDVKMSATCAQLISNIILTRRSYYYKTKEGVYLYNNVNLDEIYKKPGPLGKMSMSLEPVYADEMK